MEDVGADDLENNHGKNCQNEADHRIGNILFANPYLVWITTGGNKKKSSIDNKKKGDSADETYPTPKHLACEFLDGIGSYAANLIPGHRPSVGDFGRVVKVYSAVLPKKLLFQVFRCVLRDLIADMLKQFALLWTFSTHQQSNPVLL